MKKILQINTTIGYASPGKIANDIGDLIMESGNESYIAYGRQPESKSNSSVIRIGNNLDIYTHVLSTRLFDDHCFSSKKATQKLVSQIKEIKPDLIQIHNLHGYYINIEVLFSFLKDADIPVVWTFHDAWAITGHCTHFEHVGCTKWLTQCHSCPQTNTYPNSVLLDRSKQNYKDKKRLFNYPKDLTIVTPSSWLANLVNQSFLKEHTIKVIPNGVSQEIFKPRKNPELEKTLNLKNKFVVLGVCSVWDKGKGFCDFIDLAKMLSNEYAIVMVGVTKKQAEMLPDNVIAIPRTSNVEELAELYTLADVYVNLTYADTFPTTNLEALSCGTPIITYKTGGSVESVTQQTGMVVEQGNLKEAVSAITQVKDLGKSHFEEHCVTMAVDKFNKQKQYLEYIKLYQPLLGN
ncbi:glycosyltransferase [Maribacter sp. MAR_2009_72]|uniref:glycosyltransferase n=1 Tax=Maribacter sp. MAR_2009_72 TaxID=1250050 RepID=UPI00119AC4D6|nr:glycosyltransferase [Maribacter sp. MAR_2009_72]TVZ13837.1 glycosyltransferase involved in cell wall biosynthesis [Maribacter sp. MAR_2009_72]